MFDVVLAVSTLASHCVASAVQVGGCVFILRVDLCLSVCVYVYVSVCLSLCVCVPFSLLKLSNFTPPPHSPRATSPRP